MMNANDDSVSWLSEFDSAGLGLLTPEELADYHLVLTAPTPAWQPLPGPQTVAYHSPADELFYGGAGGGGAPAPC